MTTGPTAASGNWRSTEPITPTSAPAILVDESADQELSAQSAWSDRAGQVTERNCW